MPTIAAPDPSLPVIDPAAMADWCADLDKDDIEAILSQVPGQCHACVREIEAAVEGADFGKARRVAHRLKGMAANLGATRLSRCARVIEMEAQVLDDVIVQLPLLRETVTATLTAIAALH